MQFRFKKTWDDVRRKLADDPTRRQVRTSVESRLVDGFRSQISARDFQLVADQPFGFGGTNQGPKPSEYVLAALAACQEVTYRLYADALGIPLRSVSVKAEGLQDLHGFLGIDESLRAGFQQVTVTVTLDSSAPTDDLERLRETVNRHCPVLDDLRTPIPVSLTVLIKGREAEKNG
jgi:uncharacterized OsmC-like protein